MSDYSIPHAEEILSNRERHIAELKENEDVYEPTKSYEEYTQDVMDDICRSTQDQVINEIEHGRLPWQQSHDGNVEKSFFPVQNYTPSGIMAISLKLDEQYFFKTNDPRWYREGAASDKDKLCAGAMHASQEKDIPPYIPQYEKSEQPPALYHPKGINPEEILRADLVNWFNSLETHTPFTPQGLDHAKEISKFLKTAELNTFADIANKASDISQDMLQTDKRKKQLNEIENSVSDATKQEHDDYYKQTKEQGVIMSDENTNTQTETKKPYYQQNVEKVFESVKNGTAPFLVATDDLGENETVSIQPSPVIRSANTLKAYQGINQLVAQVSLREMGSKDTEVLTLEQAKRAGTYIKRDSQHFPITSFDASAEEGQKSKVYHLFPASSVGDMSKLGALQKLEERKQASDKTIVCHDSSPEKYIGSYLAAANIGAKFETDAKTMNAFQNQFVKEMGQHISDGHHTKLFELGKNANEQCKATLKELYKETNQNEVKKAYKREQSPGMSMG